MSHASNDDICHLTATEALASFRSGELSPVEVTDALIARCERLQPVLNVFTCDFFEQARVKSREAEKAYRAKRSRPLEGVLLTVKDFHSLQGELTTFGSKVFRHHIATYTVPYVQRLVDAGAIVLARTTTPEFAFDARSGRG